MNYKSIIALIILSAMAVTSWGGVSLPAQGLTIIETDNGRSFPCRMGETITVRIPNPATGGYNIITPIFDSSILKLQRKSYRAPEPASFPKLGDFGSVVFELEVIGVGETDLIIEIARDWEVNKRGEEYLKVKIMALE